MERTLIRMEQLLSRMLAAKRANDHAQVVAACREQLQLLQGISAPKMLGALWNQLGAALMRLGEQTSTDNADEALHCYERARQLMTRESMPEDWAMITGNMGKTLVDRTSGDRAASLESARELLTQAARVYQELEQPTPWAELTLELARCYRSRLRGDRGDNLEKAIALCTAITTQLDPGRASALWCEAATDLGTLYQERASGSQTENIEQAITLYNKVLRLIDPNKNRRQYVIALMEQGLAYYNRGRGNKSENLEAALKHLHIAQKEAKQIKDSPLTAKIDTNLGILYAVRAGGEKNDNRQTALQQYLSALKKIDKKTQPLLWSNVAINLSRLLLQIAPNTPQVLDLLDSAAQVRDPSRYPLEWAKVQTYLAMALLASVQKTNWDQRYEIFKKVTTHLKLALQVYSPDFMPHECHSNAQQLGTISSALGDSQTALAAFKLAVAVENRLYQRAVSLGARQNDLRQYAQTSLMSTTCYLLVKAGQVAEAVELLEQTKARLYRTLLEAEPSAAPADRSALAEYRRLREEQDRLEHTMNLSSLSLSEEQFSTMTQRLQLIQSCLSQVLDRLHHSSPRHPTALSVSQLCNTARQLQHPIIYLIFSEHGAFAITIKPDQKELSAKDVVWFGDMLTRVIATAFGKDGTGYLDGIVLGDRSKLDGSLHLLTAVVHGEFEHHLAEKLAGLGYCHATLIPTGPFNLLPPMAKPESKLSVAHSYSAYATASSLAMRKERASREFFVGIGNPSCSLPALRHAKLEVEQIGALFPARQKAILLEQQATKEELSKYISQASYLHFACHGKFDLGDPLKSALYLANETTITINDLLYGGIKLGSCRLAVLSACQTGIVDFRSFSPDDALGFATGMLKAGAVGVITTLWKIDDFATALFMHKLYELIISENVPPPRALQQSQLWLRALTWEQILQDPDLRPFHLHSESTLRHASLSAAPAVRPPPGRPFAAPSCWAAFVYIGA